MKQFEMKNARSAKQLYKKIKFHFPRWRKFQWIYHGIWIIAITLTAIGIFYLYSDGGFTQSFFSSAFIFLVCCGIIELLTMPVIYAILIAQAGELLVPTYHSVVIDKDNLKSEWLPLPMQIRNTGGDHVITTFPYENIKRIVWNEYLQRLEIYGEFIQKVHPTDFFNQEWTPKERTYFTLCKTEKVLYLYNYFPDMEELITSLETESGLTVER